MPAERASGWLAVRDYEIDTELTGGETLDVAGIAFEVVAIPGHSPDHIAFYADGCLFSGDLLFAGSVGRVDLAGGDWDTLLESARSLTERYAPETTVYPGHGPPTTLGDRARAQPVPRGAARVTPRFEAPRGTHDILPSEQPLLAVGGRDDGGGVPRRTATAAIETPGIRGHRPDRAHVGRGLRRRAEGDVHVHRPRRPLVDAAARGHGADLPRLRPARPAPRAAAAEAVHDRADVALRPSAEGPLPRALAAERRGDRHATTRRSTPRSSSSTTSCSRRLGVTDYVARAELDRRRELPPGVRRAAGRMAGRARRRARRGGAREARDDAAARLRREERARAGGACGRAEDRRLAVRRMPRALRAGSARTSTRSASRTSSCRRSCAGSTTTRARRSSSRTRRSAPRTRSAAAAATTA